MYDWDVNDCFLYSYSKEHQWAAAFDPFIKFNKIINKLWKLSYYQQFNVTYYIQSKLVFTF